MTPILETARLQLRELVPSDLDFVAEMLADAEVMRYYPRRLTRDLSADWIARQMERYEKDGHGIWLAVERTTGRLVGQVGLVRRSVNGVDECEVNYLMHHAFWRQGFAAEAALACRDHAFSPLGKRRVIAFVRSDNEASQGLAKKLGMAVIGRKRHGSHVYLLFAIDNSCR